MSALAARRHWTRPTGTPLALTPDQATAAADRARKAERYSAAALFDASAAALHQARCTLGPERDRLNLAGEAAWCAAAARLIGAAA